MKFVITAKNLKEYQISYWSADLEHYKAQLRFELCEMSERLRDREIVNKLTAVFGNLGSVLPAMHIGSYNIRIAEERLKVLCGIPVFDYSITPSDSGEVVVILHWTKYYVDLFRELNAIPGYNFESTTRRMIEKATRETYTKDFTLEVVKDDS
jgi:hypothetical protein